MSLLSLEGRREQSKIEKIGKEAVERGKVGVLTLAGGVGSRLGYDGPKGLFEIDDGRERLSLFERQARKIGKIFWIVMVSPKTRTKTVEHLQKKICRGEEAVYVIEQEEIAAEGMDGEALYDMEKSPIRMPNGNGGVFKALSLGRYTEVRAKEARETEGSLYDVMERRGIEYLNVISVDNVLVKVADSWAVGWALESGCDVVSAAVKVEGGKKQGVFVKESEKSSEKGIRICEYIDEPSGEVVRVEGVPLGNIANHVVKVEFLKSIDVGACAYHKAVKKIPHEKDPAPQEPNGVKKELFIFDGFNLSRKQGVVEYGRDAYEGLKNKDGNSDSISSCTAELKREAREE